MLTRIRHLITLMTILGAALPLCGSTKVSLLTCHEGADIYQLEGHTALRIRDDRTGDHVVNWGLFDFDAPNFVYRFVKGETDYMAGAAPTPYFLEMYRREGRTVVEQELALTPQQSQRLMALIENNLRPENRVYRYNYVLDNCATRPLALIEQAIGDTLTFRDGGALDNSLTSTFRNAMRSYHTNYPWYQFGIDLALGSGIDRPITYREASFAPVSLQAMLREAYLPDDSPLVISTDTLVQGSPDVILPPTPWYLTPLFWGILVALCSLAVSMCQIRRRAPSTMSRIFDTILFSVNGIAGLILTFLIFVSVHEATSPNWLYLWLNPLCFIAAVAVWSKRLEKLLVCYQILNFALLIVLSVILIAGVQSANAAFYPLIAADAMRALSYLITCHREKASR